MAPPTLNHNIMELIERFRKLKALYNLILWLPTVANAIPFLSRPISKRGSADPKLLLFENFLSGENT